MTKPPFYLFLFLIFFRVNAFSQPEELGDKIEQYIRPYVETNNFNGTILVSQKGQILFSKAYGFANQEFMVPNNLNTIFHIASLSKTFTAAAILILEQRGLLKTEDILSKYIPDYPSGNKITIHHLLAHTSGIPHVTDLPEYENASLQPQTPESVIALFKNKPLEFQPGEEYLYSSSNYNILAFIIERVSGMKYNDFLSKNIFQPLGMDRTLDHNRMDSLIINMADGYTPEGSFALKKAHYVDWSSKVGNGSLASTVSDLLKWNTALLDTSVLSGKSKDKMFTEYVDSGYGWYLYKYHNRNYIFMNGYSAGFSAHMGMYPEEEVCVVVLSNIEVFIPRRIAIDLAGILFHEPVEIPTIGSFKPTKAQLQEVAGTYKFGKDFFRPNFTMEVTTRGEDLFFNWGPLVPSGPLKFFQRSYWSKISFSNDAAGKIYEMTFDNYHGVKVR